MGITSVVAIGERRTTMKILAGLLDRWPYLKAMGFVAENALWLIRHRFGWIRITYGTHKSLRLQESVNYVEQVFADYLRYGVCTSPYPSSLRSRSDPRGSE